MSELGDAATAVLGEKKANRVYTALKPTPIRDIEATTRKNNWFISYGCNKKTFSKWKISHLLHHNISVCMCVCMIVCECDFFSSHAATNSQPGTI